MFFHLSSVTPWALNNNSSLIQSYVKLQALNKHVKIICRPRAARNLSTVSQPACAQQKTSNQEVPQPISCSLTSLRHAGPLWELLTWESASSPSWECAVSRVKADRAVLHVSNKHWHITLTYIFSHASTEVSPIFNSFTCYALLRRCQPHVRDQG